MSYTFGSRSAVGRSVSRDAADRLLFVAIAMCLSIAAGFVIAQEGWLRWATELRKLGVLPLPFWLVGVVGGYTLATRLRSDWLAPVNIVVGLFVWLFFLSPIILIFNDEFRFPYTSNPSYYLPRAGWLVLLGLVAFLVGYGRPGTGGIARLIGRVADRLSCVDRWRLAPLVACAYIVGLVVLVYRHEAGGGFDFILSERVATPGGRWWVGLAILLMPVACLLAYCFWGYKRRLLPLVVVVAMLLIAFGLRAITGRRVWALEPIVMVIFAARYLDKKLRVSLPTAGVMAAILILSLLGLGDYRTHGAFSQRAALEGWLPVILHETSRLEGLTWVVEFIPQVKPHQWGIGFLGEAFQIPIGSIFSRLGITWWHTGRITQIAVSPYAQAGTATTPVGTLYHEFSVLGVAVGMFLFGWLMKVLYTTLVRDRGTPTAIAIYAPFLYFAWLFTIGGSWQGIYHLQVQIGFILLLLYLARPRWVRHSPGVGNMMQPVRPV